MNGAVQWQAQYVLLQVTWPLVLYVLCLSIISKTKSVKVPGVTIILLLLAMVAIFQALVVFL